MVVHERVNFLTGLSVNRSGLRLKSHDVLSEAPRGSTFQQEAPTSTLFRTAFAIASLAVAQTLWATDSYKDMCDITASPCWGDNSKCNIHFKNHTGLGTGDSHGTYNQKSWASTIKVEARYFAPNRVIKTVGNRLKILAGQKATMNLDNRVEQGGFGWIHVGIPGEPTSMIDIPCSQIKRILDGDRTCHIWNTTSAQFDLAYSCNGGSVIGRGYYEGAIDFAKQARGAERDNTRLKQHTAAQVHRKGVALTVMLLPLGMDFSSDPCVS